MQSPYKTFNREADAAENGVVFDLDGQYGFEHESETFVTTFKMKFIGPENIQYHELLQRLMKPFMKRNGTLKWNSKQQSEVVVRAFVVHCLVGWENFEEARTPELRAAAIAEHGKPIIEYSRDNALAMFNAWPEYMEVLLEFASEPSYFNVVGEKKKNKLGNDFAPITPAN